MTEYTIVTTTRNHNVSSYWGFWGYRGEAVTPSILSFLNQMFLTY